jgi:hypothetical protein
MFMVYKKWRGEIMRNVLTMKQAKRYVDFLEENKDLVGLSDWIMKVNMREFDKEPNTVARCVPDPFENVLIIYLTKEFLELEREQQLNILLHELIHGRICIFNAKVQKFKDDEEELMVNDLTRGLERLNDFTI